MMQEGRGAGGTGWMADTEGLLRGPAETHLFPWEGEDREDRQGGAQAEGAAWERSAGRGALSACAVCVPFHAKAASRQHCIKSATLYHRAGMRGERGLVIRDRI